MSSVFTWLIADRTETATPEPVQEAVVVSPVCASIRVVAARKIKIGGFGNSEIDRIVKEFHFGPGKDFLDYDSAYSEADQFANKFVRESTVLSIAYCGAGLGTTKYLKHSPQLYEGPWPDAIKALV